VVAPAVLKDMWLDASESAGQPIEFASVESLSRAGMESTIFPTTSGDERPLIVDEAHHFRNPRTRRYAALARVSSGRRVLMLSATPVHNKRRDLIALFSLFMGSAAERLTGSELGRLVVRRDQSVVTDT